MKLITKTIEKKIEQNPLYSHENIEDPYENKILIKFFDPYTQATWLVTEAEKQENGNILFYGYVHILEGEWGYFTLQQLLQLEGRIERDKYLPDNRTIKEELKCLGLC